MMLDNARLDEMIRRARKRREKREKAILQEITRNARTPRFFPVAERHIGEGLKREFLNSAEARKMPRTLIDLVENVAPSAKPIFSKYTLSIRPLPKWIGERNWQALTKYYKQWWFEWRDRIWLFHAGSSALQLRDVYRLEVVAEHERLPIGGILLLELYRMGRPARKYCNKKGIPYYDYLTLP